MKQVIWIDDDPYAVEAFEERLNKLKNDLKNMDSEMLMNLMMMLMNPMTRDLAYAMMVAWGYLLEAYNMGFIGTDSFGVMVLEDDEYVGIADSDSIKNPYKLALDTKDLVLKKFARQIIDDEMRMVVVVKVPWHSQKTRRYKEAGETYYRAWVRRTFLEPQDDEWLAEASKKLAGIMVIDEMQGESYCYAYSNPNYVEEAGAPKIKWVLEDVVNHGDYGTLEDFKWDNY